MQSLTRNKSGWSHRGHVIKTLFMMDTLLKIKVFLVDDDKMFAELLKNALSEKRIEIRIFLTGEECLENIQKEAPEIVILDYYLSTNCAFAMNGIQVLNKIKQLSPGTEVILLSSSNTADIALDSVKYGAYDYIAKDTSAVGKIKNTVRHICDNIEQNYDFEKEKKKLRRVNIAVVAIVIIAYILNRLF